MNEIQIAPEISSGIESLEQWAGGLRIATEPEYEFAVEAVKQVKQARARVVEKLSDPKTKAHAAWKSIVKLEKEFTDKCDIIEHVAKSAMMTYRQAEEEKRLAEERRLQAIADEQARKEREKAEQAAAKQRAIEDEARRKAEAARAEAAKLDADTKEAASLIREAEAAERKAAAAAVKAEAKIEDAAAVVAPVIQIAKAAPVKGASIKTLWRAELTDMKKLIAAAAAGNSLATSFLSFNEEAANKIAVATKGAVECPGVDFCGKDSMAVRSK